MAIAQIKAKLSIKLFASQQYGQKSAWAGDKNGSVVCFKSDYNSNDFTHTVYQ